MYRLIKIYFKSKSIELQKQIYEDRKIMQKNRSRRISLHRQIWKNKPAKIGWKDRPIKHRYRILGSQRQNQKYKPV